VKVYADTNGTVYAYTPEGRLATRLWARGISTTYGYDACCGALTNISYSDDTPSVSFTHDRLGRQKVAQTFLSAHWAARRRTDIPYALQTAARFHRSRASFKAQKRPSARVVRVKPMVLRRGFWGGPRA
jgi:hypothetical protein